MTGQQDSGTQNLSVWRRTARRLGVVAGTALVGIVSTATIISATSMISANSEGVNVEKTSPPLSVNVAPIELQSEYSVTSQFIGRVEASKDAQLGFETGGTVESVLVDEGDFVKAGDVLANLDTRILEADQSRQIAAIEAMESRIELAELSANRQKDLADRSFASQQKVDETRLLVAELKAQRDELFAGLEAIKVRLDKAQLRAPFAGKITHRYVDPGTRTAPASPVVDLLETEAPRVRVGLANTATKNLVVGSSLEAFVNGQKLNLSLVSFGADVDPVTRTRVALFALDGSLPRGIAIGDVVRVETTQSVTEHGAWVPISALTPGVRGLWTIYTASKTGDGVISQRESVELLYADETRAFVRGAFSDGSLAILDGTHRLGNGQQIVPVFEG